MKTTDLKSGHRYRLKCGTEVTIENIFGRGRNRQVRLSVADQEKLGPYTRYQPIVRFARRIVDDLGPMEAPQ